MPTARRGQVSIEIAAPPELVYDLIADVARMGEWSPECYRCDWLDGATTAAVGARFRGYNRRGAYRWERSAVITDAERGREFAFMVVDDQSGRDQTYWQYALQPAPSGTLVTESFRFLWCPLSERVMEALIPRGRQMNRGIEETLQRIKKTAETVG